MLHSTLFLRTFNVGTRKSPPLPCPARPQPRSRPGPRSRTCPPCPLLPSPARVRHLRPNFSLSTVFLLGNSFFFPRHAGFFPHKKEIGQGKNLARREKFGQREKLTALKRIYTQRRAAHNVVPRHLVELQPSAYTMLRKSLQLSQISMLTLTVTPSRGSFGFFRITSFGCCGMSAAA